MSTAPERTPQDTLPDGTTQDASPAQSHLAHRSPRTHHLRCGNSVPLPVSAPHAVLSCARTTYATDWPEAAPLEEFTTRTSDGIEIAGWYWPGERPLTLVVFHGNGGHRGHRSPWLRELRSRLKAHICIVDYRGYAENDGSPTEQGLYLDAEATQRWLDERGAPPSVYFGESLGSGVAVELAKRVRPAGLIVQSGFSSCVDVAGSAYPVFPVSLLMKDRYESVDKIAAIGCPLLVIHGDRDRIVPTKFGRKLFEAASEPKEWLEIKGAGHNDLAYLAGDEYYDALDAFLERCTAE